MPLAPGAPPQYGLPVQPGSPPPEYPEGFGGQPPKRRRTGLIIAIIVGLVVVLGAGGVGLAVYLQRQAEAREQAEAEAADAAARAGAVASVEAMLQALADADAETALSYLEDEPTGDQTLLSDEVLAGAAEPISAISVTEPSGVSAVTRYGEIAVSYSVGEVQATQTYYVTDTDEDDSFLISGVLTEVQHSPSLAGVELTLNGVPVSQDDASFALFPGSYTVGTSSAYFGLTGTTSFAITEFEADPLLDLMPVLTDEGVAKFREAVSAQVHACVASNELAPGCGLDLAPVLGDGTEVFEGTVARTLSTDAQAALDAMVPTLSSSNPTLARGESVGTVSAKAECRKGSQTGICDILPAFSTATPAIDMSDPDLTVLWE
ncbi:MAG: hypothetical protein ACK5H2_14020 [Beutenbergiaceae bacterium]